MDLIAYSVLLVAIGFGVIGQLLLKKGMARQPGFQLSDFPSLFGSVYVVGGFASYGISVLFYLTALEDINLSLAYPTVSLSYVLITALSKLIFKESVGLGRWMAVALICAGVALVGLGAL